MKRQRLNSVVSFFTILVCCFFILLPADCHAAPPEPQLLQTGDLIWPKKAGAIVPYNSSPGDANDNDAANWRKEKEAYLNKIRLEPDPSPEDKVRYSALEKMSYEQFINVYLNDSSPGQAATFGTGLPSVGHVGIVQVTDGQPYVLEAVPGHVQRTAYVDWLQAHKDELVWVGRLKDVSPEKRAAIADLAAKQVGKPYDFWNFDLKNVSGFYCSKLAWLSILLGVGFAPDDDPNSQRTFWYSPKQLMKSKHVELIFNPGEYGSQ
jgi:hypothetical protein